MPVMDEFREERETLKNASFKKKWEWFWEYHKLHVAIGGFLAFFVISMVHHVLTAKDNAMYGFFLNSYSDDAKNDAYITAFAEDLEIDLKEYQLILDTTLQYTPNSMDTVSYNTTQKVMVTMAAGDADFLAADDESFAYFATNESFFDLRELFTSEELEKLQDYIYYIDMDVVRARSEIVDSGNFSDYTLPVYDNFAPEEMADPVPIALCIENCADLKPIYYFPEGSYPLGVVINTKNLDTTVAFIRHIFAEQLQ